MTEWIFHLVFTCVLFRLTVNMSKKSTTGNEGDADSSSIKEFLSNIQDSTSLKGDLDKGPSGDFAITNEAYMSNSGSTESILDDDLYGTSSKYLLNLNILRAKLNMVQISEKNKCDMIHSNNINKNLITEESDCSSPESNEQQTRNSKQSSLLEKYSSSNYSNDELLFQNDNKNKFFIHEDFGSVYSEETENESSLQNSPKLDTIFEVINYDTDSDNDISTSLTYSPPQKRMRIRKSATNSEETSHTEFKNSDKLKLMLFDTNSSVSTPCSLVEYYSSTNYDFDKIEVLGMSEDLSKSSSDILRPKYIDENLVLNLPSSICGDSSSSTTISVEPHLTVLDESDSNYVNSKKTISIRSKSFRQPKSDRNCLSAPEYSKRFNKTLDRKQTEASESSDELEDLSKINLRQVVLSHSADEVKKLKQDGHQKSINNFPENEFNVKIKMAEGYSKIPHFENLVLNTSGNKVELKPASFSCSRTTQCFLKSENNFESSVSDDFSSTKIDTQKNFLEQKIALTRTSARANMKEIHQSEELFQSDLNNSLRYKSQKESVCENDSFIRIGTKSVEENHKSSFEESLDNENYQEMKLESYSVISSSPSTSSINKNYNFSNVKCNNEKPSSVNRISSVKCIIGRNLSKPSSSEAKLKSNATSEKSEKNSDKLKDIDQPCCSYTLEENERVVVHTFSSSSASINEKSSKSVESSKSGCSFFSLFHQTKSKNINKPSHIYHWKDDTNNFDNSSLQKLNETDSGKEIEVVGTLLTTSLTTPRLSYFIPTFPAITKITSIMGNITDRFLSAKSTQTTINKENESIINIPKPKRFLTLSGNYISYSDLAGKLLNTTSNNKVKNNHVSPHLSSMEDELKNKYVVNNQSKLKELSKNALHVRKTQSTEMSFYSVPSVAQSADEYDSLNVGINESEPETDFDLCSGCFCPKLFFSKRKRNFFT